MTIASEIQRIQTNIANAYNAAEAKGATMPVTENSDNLSTAIASISTGITPTGSITFQDNGTYDVTTYAQAVVDVAGGAQVEATNYTGANLSEGDKVWINPYYYEGGTIDQYSGMNIGSDSIFILDNDVMYFRTSSDGNKLYHKNFTAYSGVTLNFYLSHRRELIFEPDGCVYVYGTSNTQEENNYHFVTYRIDAGLVWGKEGYVPIHNSSELLVKAISSTNVAIVKIDKSTGNVTKTWDLSSSGVNLSYYYSSSQGLLNIYHKVVAINDNTILLNNGDSASASAVRQIVLNNDGTVTVTSPTISGVSQSPFYGEYIGYINGYLFKMVNYVPCVYDITDLSNIVDKTVDLGLPAGYSSGESRFRPDKNIVYYNSGYGVSNSSFSAKAIKIDPITRNASEIALDYLALSNNISSARYMGISFNGNDISDFYYYYNWSNYINHIVETSGNNLVAYRAGNITQDTQTGTAAESISAGSTGLVNVYASITPSGTISITQDGTYNVTNYATANVTVGPKHNVGDVVKDDSNNDVGVVSGFFTDSNNQEYAVVCLNAVDRLDQGLVMSVNNSPVSGIPEYTSQLVWSAPETATTNTDAILTQCTTSGYTSSACTHCRSKSFTIGGVTYYGQLPNLNELSQIYSLGTLINSQDSTASTYPTRVIGFGITTASSNLYNSSNCWDIFRDGRATWDYKNQDFFVVPVLEIPL